MELLQYWKIVRKRWWLILIFLLVAGAGAGYYISKQVPQYRTSTTLAINPSTLNSAVTYQVENQLIPLANTYTEFMKTRSFAQLVTAQLKTQPLPVQPSEDEILKAIIAQYILDTQLFRITTTYSDPVVAKALADTTAQMLITANIERTRAEQTALLEAQLDNGRVQERDRLIELNSVLREELQYYEDQIKLLEQEITTVRNGPQSNQTDNRVSDLRAELLQYRSERVKLLASMAEAQQALLNETLNSKAAIDTVVVVEEALLPTTPLARNLLQPLLAALAAALALGIGGAVGLEYLDYTVKSPEDLDQVYGIPTQGVIGLVGEVTNARNQSASLIMLTAPRSPTAEAMRAIRTAVRMAGASKPIHSLLITSAGPSEGKTFVTTNLAISLAQAGKQVILVDLDLRRPQVHKRFGLRSEPGFTNLVVDRGEYTIGQLLQPTQIPNLQVLTCGTIPPNPAELLSAEATLTLLQQLQEAADIIIYDTPPITVTDALLIVPHVDGVLQVVGARKQRIDIVRRTKDLLERAGARIIGPILNQVTDSDMGYYASYYSSYNNYVNNEYPTTAKRHWLWRRKPRRQPVQQASPRPDFTPYQIDTDAQQALTSDTFYATTTTSGNGRGYPFQLHITQQVNGEATKSRQ